MTVGLRFNAGKCKVQSSSAPVTVGRPFPVAAGRVPMVAGACGFKILGTILTTDGKIAVELANRFSAAWAKFHQILPMLKRHHISVRKRLRLLHSIVGASLLWCAETWTLTASQMRSLRALQRKMMRRFAAPSRRQDETWVEWIRRATRHVDALRRRASTPCWLEQHLSAKWF